MFNSFILISLSIYFYVLSLYELTGTIYKSFLFSIILEIIIKIVPMKRKKTIKIINNSVLSEKWSDYMPTESNLVEVAVNLSENLI